MTMQLYTNVLPGIWHIITRNFGDIDLFLYFVQELIY